MSKILELRTENVKRLKAVHIKPDGSLVVIGGNNGQGKSSVLDSIMYALAGGKTLPSEPVRRGQKKASVEIDIGEFIVRRTFTPEGGTSLTITNKDGLKYPSPQAMLDGLVGSLSFDPLEFARRKPAEQSASLRAVASLDFTALDQKRVSLFSERTVANREVESLKNRLAAIPIPAADLPAEETSAADILKEQGEAAAQNAENDKKRTAAKAAGLSVSACEATRFNAAHKVAALERELAEAQEILTSAKDAEAAARSSFSALTAEAKELADVDLAPFAEKLLKVEQTNRAVRQRKDREALQQQLKVAMNRAEMFTTGIEEIDQTKRNNLAAAKFPVPGLSITEDGEVMYNDVPFSQASSAEQLRVSIGMALSLNPKLRILLIRDGSLLDADSLKVIAEMAEQNEAQVWMERVSTGGEVSVIIEDGMAKTDEDVAAPEALTLKGDA
jgi:AAA domain